MASTEKVKILTPRYLILWKQLKTITVDGEIFTIERNTITVILRGSSCMFLAQKNP
ncbi:MAG: hypothetical protein QXP59_03215 [Saccharolobus sp.]